MRFLPFLILTVLSACSTDFIDETSSEIKVIPRCQIGRYCPPVLPRRDLAVLPDLSAPRDLAVPLDVAVPPDIATPPDLAHPADLYVPYCGNSICDNRETSINCCKDCPCPEPAGAFVCLLTPGGKYSEQCVPQRHGCYEYAWMYWNNHPWCPWELGQAYCAGQLNHDGLHPQAPTFWDDLVKCSQAHCNHDAWYLCSFSCGGFPPNWDASKEPFAACYADK